MKKYLFAFLFSLAFLGADAQQTNQPEKPKGNQPIREFLPQFPGGNDSLYAFIGRNLRYPQVGIDNKIEGKVLCTFIVRTNGVLDNITVIKSLHKDFDEECIRIIKLMPTWIPGMQNEQAVEVKIVLPIKFSL